MKLIQRKWKLAVAMACAAVLVVTVAYAATAGGQEDPLITLSYLEQVFQPQVEDTVEQAVTAQRQQLQQRLEQAISGWNAQVQEAIAGLEAGESALFQAVTLSPGQSLVGQAGCELVVRVGAAWCQDGELINASAGTQLGAGQELAVNHLHLVGEGGCTVQAASDTVQLLVRGPYTILE